MTGAFRTGKSFLLNYLIRYLTHLESGAGGNWLGGEEDELTGFTWRRGAGTQFVHCHFRIKFITIDWAFGVLQELVREDRIRSFNWLLETETFFQ